jgi:hypothetical protein
VFLAPVPVEHLRGESVALIDGAIWELLTVVPGQSIGWANAAGLSAAYRARKVRRNPPGKARALLGSYVRALLGADEPTGVVAGMAR